MAFTDDLSRLVNAVITAASSEGLRERPVPLGMFRVERRARDLLGPARKCAEYHRGRAEHYTKELEAAEKDLREKGVSVEVFDPSTGTAMSVQNAMGNIASGLISAPLYGSAPGQAPRFQPHIDQGLLQKVERAKTKMLDHRAKAEQYEKHARAFTCAPDVAVALTAEEVTYFRLES